MGLRLLIRLATLGALLLIGVMNLWLAILRRKNPEFARRIAATEAAQRAAMNKPLGSVARGVFGVMAIFCAAVTIVGVKAFVELVDLRFFLGIILLPTAYAAVACGYLAISGKNKSFPEASMFWLWPW
jgi:hypothetical protein